MKKYEQVLKEIKDNKKIIYIGTVRNETPGASWFVTNCIYVSPKHNLLTRNHLELCKSMISIEPTMFDDNFNHRDDPHGQLYFDEVVGLLEETWKITLNDNCKEYHNKWKYKNGRKSGRKKTEIKARTWVRYYPSVSCAIKALVEELTNSCSWLGDPLQLQLLASEKFKEKLEKLQKDAEKKREEKNK